MLGLFVCGGDLAGDVDGDDGDGDGDGEAVWRMTMRIVNEASKDS